MRLDNHTYQQYKRFMTQGVPSGLFQLSENAGFLLLPVLGKIWVLALVCWMGQKLYCWLNSAQSGPEGNPAGLPRSDVPGRMGEGDVGGPTGAELADSR